MYADIFKVSVIFPIDYCEQHGPPEVYSSINSNFYADLCSQNHGTASSVNLATIPPQEEMQAQSFSEKSLVTVEMRFRKQLPPRKPTVRRDPGHTQCALAFSVFVSNAFLVFEAACSKKRTVKGMWANPAFAAWLAVTVILGLTWVPGAMAVGPQGSVTMHSASGPAAKQKTQARGSSVTTLSLSQMLTRERGGPKSATTAENQLEAGSAGPCRVAGDEEAAGHACMESTWSTLAARFSPGDSVRVILHYFHSVRPSIPLRAEI